MWVNRNAKYPHRTTASWWTRSHLLVRKINLNDGCVTPEDRRIAGILLEGHPSAVPPGTEADTATREMLKILEAICDAAYPYESA
jgi:hypothetical protein